MGCKNSTPNDTKGDDKKTKPNEPSTVTATVPSTATAPVGAAPPAPAASKPHAVVATAPADSAAPAAVEASHRVEQAVAHPTVQVTANDTKNSVRSLPKLPEKKNGAAAHNALHGKSPARPVSTPSVSRRSTSTSAVRRETRTSTTASADTDNHPTKARRSRTSLDSLQNAMGKYPTYMAQRMQETHDELHAVPDDATPYLGMEIADTAGGLVVESVAEGGPAHLIGILPGDVLTGIGSIAVTGETRVAELVDSVRRTCKVGRVVPVKFMQSGLEVEAPLWIMTTDADLDDRPFYFNPQVSRVVARRRSTVSRS